MPQGQRVTVQVGSLSVGVSTDSASLHTAETCLLCKSVIDEAEAVSPVYVESWMVGYVHDSCYDTSVESLKLGLAYREEGA